MGDAAGRLAALLEEAVRTPLPLRVRAWDGSEAGPPGTPVVVVRSRRALRRILWRPDELGLVRGWVAGDLDVEGDLYAALSRFADLGDRVALAEAPPSAARRLIALVRDPDVLRLTRR